MSLSQYMIIGKFVPSNSFIHKLDARSKLTFVFLFVFLVFIVDTLTGYIILSLIVLLGIIVSRISIGYYLKGLIPITWIVLFTTVIHLTMTKGGTVLFQWNWLVIYSQGVEQAVFIALRLILLVIVASMLTLTTQPIDITVGLEQIFKPLKLIKVPVDELALMMAISLRFIPTLMDETDKIITAQKARGANFEAGTIRQRLLSVIAIIIPLFISTFKRADELAMAMEARGYRGGVERTRLRISAFSWRDLLLAIIFILLFGILIYLRGI